MICLFWVCNIQFFFFPFIFLPNFNFIAICKWKYFFFSHTYAYVSYPGPSSIYAVNFPFFLTLCGNLKMYKLKYLKKHRIMTRTKNTGSYSKEHSRTENVLLSFCIWLALYWRFCWMQLITPRNLLNQILLLQNQNVQGANLQYFGEFKYLRTWWMLRNLELPWVMTN